MWEENGNPRKQHSAASRTKLVNHPHYDQQTDDLHAWSIYRQNLNADLSECAIGVNKSSNTERPFGNFQLKETTVNNILRHPKYGPRLKQDPYNYLRFGLPRAKAHLNSQLDSPNRNQSNLVHSNHQRLNYESNEIKNLRKANSRHSLSSNEVEISSLNGENADQVDRSNQRTSQNEHTKLNGNKTVFNGRLTSSNDPHRNDKRIPAQQQQQKYSQQHQQNGIIHHSNHHAHHHPTSNYLQSSPKNRNNNLIAGERDSPAAINHTNLHNNHRHDHLFTNQQPQQQVNTNNHHYLGNSFVDNGTATATNQPKFPHLIVKNLYFELDRTSNSRRVCGAQRQKIRIIDNVSFEVRAGEMLAILATNGKIYLYFVFFNFLIFFFF